MDSWLASRLFGIALAVGAAVLAAVVAAVVWFLR